MILIKKYFFFLFVLLFVSCSSKRIIVSSNKSIISNIDSKVFEKKIEANFKHSNEVLNVSSQEVNDTTFVNLKNYSNKFLLDMKYATSDNFLKTKVYDCAECYLRFKTVRMLINANDDFLEKGYRIKLFDCYRPLNIQKKMWKIVSNPEYVADPSKGSIHNRGGAVDITLVDKDDKELYMGTDFDYFGVEASHNFKNLTEEVIFNRKMLKEIMIKNNFKPFDSEWWHYNLKDSNLDKLANFKWECN